MAYKYKKNSYNVNEKYEVPDPSIIVFSKDNCPYCMKVEHVLDALDLNYTKFKLGEDFTKEEFYKKFGMSATFPKVEVDDEVIGGCQDSVDWFKSNGFIPLG